MSVLDFLHTRSLRLSTPLFDAYHGRPTSIWDAPGDWDVCLVLDGCRVDLWREAAERVSWLPRGDVLRSVGSMSPEWITRTFSRYHRGTEPARGAAYVTANPFTGKLDYPHVDGLPLIEQVDVRYLDEVWRDGWEDGDVSTVPPRTVCSRALHAWRNRDDLGFDRLVVHFMQPHTPWPARPEWFVESRDVDAFGEPERERELDERERDVWLRLREGELERSEVWRAYRDALDWVLVEVYWLARNMNATIAVTSDHGQGLGEWGIYSHPPRIPVGAVRNVPWALLEGDGVKDDPGEAPPRHGSRPDVDERLEALGYSDDS